VAGSQAPMFMILDKKEAGQRKQTQLKNKEYRAEKVSSMKYDAWSFICIDSKCLNYPPRANFLEIQAARSKQTNNDGTCQKLLRVGKDSK
jgi:hypothetical protein